LGWARHQLLPWVRENRYYQTVIPSYTLSLKIEAKNVCNSAHFHMEPASKSRINMGIGWGNIIPFGTAHLQMSAMSAFLLGMHIKRKLSKHGRMWMGFYNNETLIQCFHRKQLI
jgi:hypothetical protein